MAISNAVNLANLSSGDAFTVDSVNDRVGVASTTPTEALTVVGVVSATSFFGDGSNLEGVASAGLGTALGESGGLDVIYYTDKVLTISDTITVDPPATTNIAYTQYSEIAVDENKDLIVADGDDFIPDILGLSTEGSALLGGAGGRVRADNFTNRAGNGAPNFPSGITGTTGIFSSDVSIADKIVHTGDTNTAIRFPATDTFTVETAGSERLRILSDGTVATGGLTATPGTVAAGSYIQAAANAGFFSNGYDGKFGTSSNHPVYFQVNGSSKASITSGGDLQITDGNLKLAAGHGIDFSATGDAGGMTSELLDDYEEGTWTPGVGGNATYTGTPSGTYTKVGRFVYVTCDMTINVIGTGSATVISTLPFASIGGLENSSAVGYWSALSRNVTSLMACTNSTQVVFTDTTSAASATGLNNGVFQNGTNIRFSLSYQTNA